MPLPKKKKKGTETHDSAPGFMVFKGPQAESKLDEGRESVYAASPEPSVRHTAGTQ